MKTRYYNFEVCYRFNNLPTDKWFSIESCIPTLYDARRYLYDYAGGLENTSKMDECIKAAPYQIVLFDGQTWDMCDTTAFRIVMSK